MTSVNYMTYAPIGNFYTIYPGAPISTLQIVSVLPGMNELSHYQFAIPNFSI